MIIDCNVSQLQLQHQLCVLYGFIWVYSIMWNAPTPPIPRRRQCGMPHRALTQAWSNMSPCLAPGPGLGLGPLLSTADLKKTASGKDLHPYMLKCVVLRVLVTFYGTLQIWHSRQKWLSLQEPHRNSVHKNVLCIPPFSFSSCLLGNYWNDRTLTRMSTRKYIVAVLITCRIQIVICLSVTTIRKFQL